MIKSTAILLLIGPTLLDFSGGYRGNIPDDEVPFVAGVALESRYYAADPIFVGLDMTWGILDDEAEPCPQGQVCAEEHSVKLAQQLEIGALVGVRKHITSRIAAGLSGRIGMRDVSGRRGDGFDWPHLWDPFVGVDGLLSLDLLTCWGHPMWLELRAGLVDQQIGAPFVPQVALMFGGHLLPEPTPEQAQAKPSCSFASDEDAQ